MGVEVFTPKMQADEQTKKDGCDGGYAGQIVKEFTPNLVDDGIRIMPTSDDLQLSLIHI